MTRDGLIRDSLYVLALAAGMSGCQSTAADVQSPATQDTSAPHAAMQVSAGDGRVAGLCHRDEQIIYSCRVGQQHVSLCALGDPSADGDVRFVLGDAATGIEEERSRHRDQVVFHRTHLAFMGPTGGNAYSFTDGHGKHILYSIEGTGFKRNGLTLQDVDGVVKETSCTGAVIKMEGSRRFTRSWPEDADIADHGLPR